MVEERDRERERQCELETLKNSQSSIYATIRELEVRAPGVAGTMPFSQMLKI